MAQLEEWMRSYGPDEQFDREGRLVPELAELAPQGNRRMGANPHANGGKLTVDLDLPDFHDYAVPAEPRGATFHENTRPMGKMMRDTFTGNARQSNFRITCPDETNSNRLGDVFEVENRTFVGPVLSVDENISPDGRVMEVVSEHLGEG